MIGFLLKIIQHENEKHKQALMGFYESWLIIPVIFSLLLLSMAGDTKSYDPVYLQELFHSYANETLSKHHTGHFYNVSLPSNSSGMQVSVIRIRSREFWATGVNFSSLRIPPRVIALPFVKRIALLNENLGNWSSHYYQVPNHSLVAPVVGFSAFDASNPSTLSNEELTLIVSGDPVSILFPDIVLKDKNVTLKCVKFGAGMSVEFSNMTTPNECVAKGPGHFSVVIPFQPQPPRPLPPSPKTKDERSWKSWVIGFVAGFGGLVLLILVGVATYKLVRRKMIRKMESESEKAEPLDTTWIGRSRMPSASMIRTQPALEHEYVP